MKTAGKLTRRRLLRYAGFGAVLMVLFVMVCATSLGDKVIRRIHCATG
ncbi:MAG: hypothetical protein AB9866_30595 [Syntrophobacteraceae bacterium]